MVTQKDVAKKAGVSFITVSRVINGSKKVNPETKKRILNAIKELGYYPNIMGRALHINKINTIGVIIPFTSHIFSTPYYVDLLRGIEKVCAEKGYEILFHPKKNEIEEIDYLKLYYERKADGLLIIAPRINDEQLTVIAEKKIPALVVHGRYKDKSISFVDSDNKKGGFLATEYLIKKGHNKIAFLGGWEFVINTIDRLQGYKKALKKYNLNFKKEWILFGDYSQKSGYELTKKILSQKEIPDAIFGGDDLMAIGAIKAIKERGLRIPEDIAIIGFDDIEMGKYVEPALTTIRQQALKIGAESARLLINKINNKNFSSFSSLIVDVELIIRNSA